MSMNDENLIAIIKMGQDSLMREMDIRFKNVESQIAELNEVHLPKRTILGLPAAISVIIAGVSQLFSDHI